VASFVDRLDEAVNARVDARLAAAAAASAGWAPAPRRRSRGPLLAGIAIGACAGGLVVGALAGAAASGTYGPHGSIEYSVPSGGHYGPPGAGNGSWSWTKRGGFTPPSPAKIHVRISHGQVKATIGGPGWVTVPGSGRTG
jgi:hypothetical protein